MDFVKKITANGIQPILTIILIVILVVLITRLFSNNSTNQSSTTNIEIGRKITFEKAVENFEKGVYEVYTRGDLYVKNAPTIIPNTSAPAPTTSTIELVKNPYDNMIFLLENGSVRKLDIRAFGQNESLFFNLKNELIYMSNTKKQYTLYPVPDDTEKEVVKLFEGAKEVIDQSLPLIPIVKDFKERRFNPIERAENVYSGQWKHPVFTNDEVMTVVIQTDALTGVFKELNITGTSPRSQIAFEFLKRESTNNYDAIPEGYQIIDLPKKYKTKSS